MCLDEFVNPGPLKVQHLPCLTAQLMLSVIRLYMCVGVLDPQDIGFLGLKTSN